MDDDDATMEDAAESPWTPRKSPRLLELEGSSKRQRSDETPLTSRAEVAQPRAAPEMARPHPAQSADTAPAREAGGPLAREQLLVEGELLYGSQGGSSNPCPGDFSLGLVFGFDAGEKDYKIIWTGE